MKALSAAMSGHVAQTATTLATCWKVTRRDGAAFHFTDHDQDIPFGGATYKAATGYDRTAIASRADLSVDNLEVRGLLDSAEITERDVRAGLFDKAEVRIFRVNWADTSMGEIKLRRGWLGEVSVRGGRFVAELRGLTQVLQQRIGEVYSPTCRADLGDARCGVDLAAITSSVTVDAVTDNSVFTIVEELTKLTGDDQGSPVDDDWFNGGLATFTSGANAGLQMEIKDWAAAAKQLTLFLAMPFAVAAGDGLDIYPGCDKTLAQCRDKFANVANMRAEPYVPGTDQVLKVPDAQ